MTELFNTPFETALRVLLLLETEARKDFSINMIACVDFAALYGKSFDISEMNLHGDNLFKFSEFATRKELTRDGIAFLVRRGFVEVKPTRNGFIYQISPDGLEFSQRLDTKYSYDYRRQVSLALQQFSGDTEQIILNKINKLAVASLEKEEISFHEEQLLY